MPSWTICAHPRRCGCLFVFRAYSAIRALERDAYEVTLRGRCRLLPYDPCRLMWRASAAALGTASGSASALEECVEMSFAASRIWFG